MGVVQWGIALEPIPHLLCPIQPFMLSTHYSSLHIPTFLLSSPSRLSTCIQLPSSSPSCYPPVIHPSTFLPSCSIQPFTLSTRYSSLHIPILPVLSSPSRYPPVIHPSTFLPSCSIQPFTLSTRYSSLHIPTFLFYPALHAIHPCNSSLHIPTFLFYPALHAIHPLFIPPHSYLPVLSSPSRYPPIIHPSTFLPSCSIQPFTLSTRVIHPSTFLPSCSIQPFMLSTRYSSLHIPTFLFYSALHAIHPLFIPPHSYLPVLFSPSRYPPVIHPSTFLPSCSIQPFTPSTRYSSLHIPTFLFYSALHAIHPLFIPPHSYLPVLSSPSRHPPIIHPSTFLPSCSIQPFTLSTHYSSLHIPTFLFYPALHAIHPLFIPPHSYLPVLSSPSRYPPIIHPSTFLPSCSIQPFTLSTRYSSLHIPTFLFYPALHAIHPLFIPPHSYLPVLSSPSRHPPIIHPSTFLPSCSIQPFMLSTRYSSLHIPTFLFYPALHAIHPLFIPPHSYLPVLSSPSCYPPVIHPSTFLPSCSIQPFTPSTHYSSLHIPTFLFYPALHAIHPLFIPPHSYLPVLSSPSRHPPIIHPHIPTFLFYSALHALLLLRHAHHPLRPCLLRGHWVCLGRCWPFSSPAMAQSWGAQS